MDAMADPFGEISFLTRSKNRVTVLRTLASEACTEADIVNETAISAVTVSRILDDFTERGWITEDESVYRTTALGDLIAADYERLHRSMDIATRLGPAHELLPFTEMDFDLRYLEDAEILDPKKASQLRTIDRWRELIREADEVVGVEPASNAAVVLVEPFHEAVTEHGLAVRAVVAYEYVDRATQTAQLRTLLREMIEAGVELYRAPPEASIPIALATIDDRAAISGFDKSGSLRVGILSSADPVYRWVRDTYQSYRVDADKLTVSDFAG